MSVVEQVRIHSAALVEQAQLVRSFAAPNPTVLWTLQGSVPLIGTALISSRGDLNFKTFLVDMYNVGESLLSPVVRLIVAVRFEP